MEINNQMRPTHHFNVQVLLHRELSNPAATLLLRRLHVDEAGNVVRAAVMKSNGTSRVDGAALSAARKMRFMLTTGSPIPMLKVGYHSWIQPVDATSWLNRSVL